MTDLLSGPEAPSDGELISRVRGGDVAAYGELFSRHKDAAQRLARQLLRGPDADDLVSEAFAKVLTVLQGGGGPDVAFRAYLLTAVRRLHVDRIRSSQRLHTTDDLTPFDPGVPFTDTAVAGFENGAAAKAFASLPERWQLVLWHLEVEGQKPADIAPLLGMSANSVSALAYRAREGLRQAFLTMHISDLAETDCRWVNEHLGAYVRKGLSKRDSGKVQGHLDGCRRCTAMYLELAEVNSNLAGLIAPLLLGGAAAGYLASAGGAGATAGGLLGLVSRVRDLVGANAGAATAVGVGAAVVAAASVVAALTLGGPADDTAADRPGTSARVSPSVPAAGSPGAGGTTAPASPGSDASAADVPVPSATAPVSTLSADGSPSASADPSAAPSLDSPVGPSLEPAPADPSGTPTAPVDPTDPGPDPTDPPTDPATGPPTEPGPAVVGQPVVDLDAGTVTVPVTRMRPTSTLDVAMLSQETTFGTPPSGCSTSDARHVSCTPAVATLARGTAVVRTADVEDWAVVLPLDFPASMEEDQVEVRASLDGASEVTAATTTFRPTRAPRFDFRLPEVVQQAHTVDGATDHYRFSTTAVLPPRVAGLRFTLSSGRFGETADCAPVADDPRTARCPDVTDGSTVDLAVSADDLTGTATPTLAVHGPRSFVASGDDADDRADLVLDPGADLSPALTVFSANPDRNGVVEIRGPVGGLRPGLQRLTYRLQGAATFTPGLNPGCDLVDATSVVCPAPADGADAVLKVLSSARTTPSSLSVSVAPGPPFVAVGADHASTVALPGRAVHDFALADLTETAHTLSGDVDLYTLSGTLGALPAGVTGLDLTVDGATVAADQPGRCARVDDVTVRCTGLSAADPLRVAVISSDTEPHIVTVTVSTPDPFDDLDARNDTTSTRVVPGTALTLTALSSQVARSGSTYPVGVRLAGVRPGVRSVTVALGDGATFAADQADCMRVDATHVRCDDPADGPLALAVVATDGSSPTTATLTATPDASHVQLGGDAAATTVLRPVHDFSLGALAVTGQTLVGNTDVHSLRTTVGAVPSAAGPLTLALTGGTLDADQDTGCARGDDTHLRCVVTGARTVDVRVRSSVAAVHEVRLSLSVPSGYDDPSAANDTRAVDVAPGVDLRLARLDADNGSPFNDDAVHVVRTRLGGVRAGVPAVTYTLSGAASLVSAGDGCTVSGRTARCADPDDGDRTFTVRATDPSGATDIEISVAAAAPFVEVTPGDNADRVRLLSQPTHDFSLGALTTTDHTVTGSTDSYTLSTTIGALPDGVDGVTLALDDGSFAASQPAGCVPSDATHVRCTDLATARTATLAVTSTATSVHGLSLSVVLPPRYADPTPANNSRSVSVAPGVDLGLTALTTPTRVGQTFTFSTRLRGVRPSLDRVVLGVDGATVTGVTGTGCSLSDGTVTCASPAEDRLVTLSVRLRDPSTAGDVTVTIAAPAPYVELATSDNNRTVRLVPPPPTDLVLTELTATSRSANRTSVRSNVHAVVTGVPDDVTSMTFDLSGPDTGSAGSATGFVVGADGASGEGAVGCAVTTTTRVLCTPEPGSRVLPSSFSIDVDTVRPNANARTVTVTVGSSQVDEGGRTANNTRQVTLP